MKTSLAFTLLQLYTYHDNRKVSFKNYSGNMFLIRWPFYYSLTRSIRYHTVAHVFLRAWCRHLVPTYLNNPSNTRNELYHFAISFNNDISTSYTYLFDECDTWKETRTYLHYFSRDFLTTSISPTRLRSYFMNVLIFGTYVGVSNISWKVMPLRKVPTYISVSTYVTVFRWNIFWVFFFCVCKPRFR